MLHARNEDNIDKFKSGIIPGDEEIVHSEQHHQDEAVSEIEPRMGTVDEDTGKDSGNESAEADSDSEDKKESIKAIQNAMVGMNVSQEFFEYFRLVTRHFTVIVRLDNVTICVKCC